MKSSVPAILSAALLVLPALAQGDRRVQAEAVVAEAADFFRTSGLDKLVHEINHNNGRFASKDASKPQLIVYDLKGKTLAFAGDPRHIGMNHSKVVAKLIEYAKSTKKGWYELSTEPGAMKVNTYFEKIGDVLITTSIPMH